MGLMHFEAALAVKDNNDSGGDESSDDSFAMVDMLVKAGADINLSVNNSHRGFELRKAVERADITRVKFLLNMGVDVNLPSTSSGVGNVLREAINKGNAELVGQC
jgi:hypothetical protein